MAGKWTAEQIPDQRGHVAVVTGANSGLGLATARELARAGATVVLAVRDTHKGERAAAEIAADTTVMQLDLASLASVREFASRFEGKLHLLINNAGVMAAPRRATPEGFESQFATNHLGHFALTGLLLKNLMKALEPRVVTVSSDMHRMGQIDFDDLQRERKYDRWQAYGQSKLANRLFCFELDRRARAAGSKLKSMAAHPGYAATVEDLPSGSFVGPDGFRGQRGHPHLVTAAGKAYDEEVARRLWEVSEELTGVSYSFPIAQANNSA